MTADRNPDGFAELRQLGDDVPETDDAAKARARSRLDSVIERERTASPRSAMKRWITLVAAIVAVSITASLVLREAADLPRPEPALLRLAAVASTQPPPSVPAGSFVYTRSNQRATVDSADVETGAEERVTVESTRETWIGADGSGLILDRPIPLGSGETKRFSGGPGTFRFTDLDQFPTEPKALLDAIKGSGYLDNPDDDLDMFAGIGTLLRDSYLDPAHREGLFLIVQGIDGVEVEANHRDPLGRLGIAVTLRDSTRSLTLVFQARTSRLLAEREIRADGTYFAATYLHVAIVDAVGERPGEGRA
jgi:hypothetical protein